MIKRKNMVHVQDVTTKKGVYKVVLESLKNDINGAPRYKAIIIVMSIGEEKNGVYNSVYTFTGHYWSNCRECEWIVEQYEKEED